jgi:hypothetical protein
MALKLAIFAKDLLEIMFFTGLIGCAAVVFFSWISILKSAFSEGDEN